ncbi:MAG: FlgD immunoglobulin-like domain containing protein, partial [candidate division WOR-3 bacterium]
SIDSVIVFKGGERTAYALPNVNDTIKSPGDSIFLKGRTNVYFLASAEAKISLNGSGYLTMQWPSALGREGQGFFYKIPQEYLFVPENYIEVKIKSVDSDNQTNTGLATTRLYYNPWAVFITIITPPIDTIYRFPEFVPIKVTFSAPAPKESLSLYYQVPDDTTFYQVPNDSFTYIPGILTDTLRLDFIDGRYLIKVAIKDGDKSYQTVWPFFVDNTPPEVVITSPHLEGSELMVYSPNADTIMPVIFIATDNLQWYFPNPPDRRATVEILDSLNNMLYSKDAENVWFGQGSRVWIRLDSINFVYDGKYYARVSISDRAGNDTTAIDSFLIDTTPPEITVLQPLSPNPFTFDDPCMTFIFTTNEWTEISLKYINLNDTTKVYERSLLFSYWDIDTNGVRDTLYIVESENWYGGYLPDGHYKTKAWAEDKAGNTTEITEFCPETLKVDKTRPIIKDCYCQPFVVKTDSDWTNLYFKQNEDDDVLENKKGLTARIYLDTIFIGTTTESNYDSTFDVGLLARGPHTFRIESYDWVGNKSIHFVQFVKGSLGSEITYPAEGDSNLTGIIVIKGWASDPNLENSEPFGKYELWYKRKPEVPRGFYSSPSPSRRGEGGTGWQAIGRFTQIKITVHDEGCGVDSARYKIEPGDWNYFANSVQFDLQNYEEGLHNFFTYAIDHLGNNQTIIKILAIDETPPNTDLTIGEPNHPLPGDSVLITSQTPLDLLAYDVWSNGVASGVENLAYRFTYLGQFRTIEGNLGQDNADQSRLLQNNKWSSETRFAQNDWVIIPDSIASLRCEGPDGWYRFDYYAQDHVENREEINSNNLVLDNTPPEGMIISPLDSTLANRTIKIIGTANDLHFALYQVYYGIGWDPQNWTLIKESNTPVINGLLTEWNTDLLNDGRYTIRLVVRDLVNNQTEDRVLIIVGEPEYSFEITGFNKCEGVAVDEAGYIYVADRNSNPIPEHNRIAKFDPYGNLILNIFDVRKPNGVDIDAYGNIYASEWAGDCITKFSPTGESLMTVTGFNKPNGVAVDRLSQIYIADQNNNRVVRTDREGNFNLIITGLGHPEGVDFCSAEIPQNTGDRRGIRIYTTDTEAGKIKVFDEFGNLMLEFGEGLNQPADVEVDSRGYIWVVDRNNNRILCYDFFGNRLLDFGTIGSGPGEFNKPEGVAVSEISGGVVKEVFVADRNNDRVCKFIIPYLIEPEISLTSRSPASPALEITEAIAYPSPFDPNKGVCRIRVTLTAEADVKLTIYTLSGKVVYRDEIFSGSGIIEFVWDGRNEIGEMVNNGVYGFLVQAKSGSESKEKEGKFFVIKE